MDDTLLSGKYQLVEELARGGMGVIYKAEHTALGRTVAIKLLHSHYAKEDSFVRRFEREARAMARLEHPGIIRVYDVEADGDRRYIVMEFCEGQDLKQLLGKHGPLEPLKAVNIALQMAEALAYAHANGVVHRDIKPGNIMVDGQGRAKLADFGIAAATNEVTLTLTGQALGTPEYMAPEQARGEPCDERSDLYSLGMVLLAMLAGATPFEGLSQVAIIGKLVVEKEELELSFPPGLSPAVGDVVRSLLRKKPRNRVPDAGTLVQRLRRLLDAEVVEADAEQKTSAGLTTILGMRAPPRTRPNGQGRMLWLGAAAVVVGALGIWGLTQLRSGGDPPPPAARVEPPGAISKVPPWERERPDTDMESSRGSTVSEPSSRAGEGSGTGAERPAVQAAADREELEARRASELEAQVAAEEETRRRAAQGRAAKEAARVEQQKQAEEAARAEKERQVAEVARQAKRDAQERAILAAAAEAEQRRSVAGAVLDEVSGRLERLEQGDTARYAAEELRAALTTAESGQRSYQQGQELLAKKQYGPAGNAFTKAESIARKALGELDGVTALASEREVARREEQRREAEAAHAEVDQLRMGLTPLMAQLDVARREAVAAEASARAPRLYREAEAMERNGLERLRDGKRGLRSGSFDVAREAFGEADALLGQAAEMFERARDEAARGGSP